MIRPCEHIVRPVPEGTRISQLWGANPSYYRRAFGIPYHNGVDYAAPLNTPVLAIADGIVIWYAYDPRGYGKYLRLYHPDYNFFSFYAHLNNTTVSFDNKVFKQQEIGFMGSTGNSTGPHLHFEIRLALDEHKYDQSPYAGIARGRVNPETLYRLQERTQETPT